MKVKLSKNMKLIAIILSLIIITYMFYNSVKEGIGGGKKRKEIKVNMRDRNGQVKQIV